MFHTDIHTNSPWQRLHPAPKTKLMDLVMAFTGLVIVATLVIVWWSVNAPSPAAPLIAPISAVNPAAPLIVPIPVLGIAGSTSANLDSPDFTQITRNLVASNSPAAFQALVQLLKADGSLPQRGILLAAMENASPTIVPVLIAALNDRDAGVRAGAAQLLGLRREYQAIAGLTNATRDPVASVRRQAVTALGAIDAWQVLPRLEQLAVNEPDYDVRQAAMAAKSSFKTGMAQAIGVSVSELRDISVTAGDLPQIYAVTSSNLYARHGTAWTLVSRLPDAPLAIATGADPTQLYLATVSTGLYRSFDSGETWEYVTFGLQTPTNLTITAMAVDPRNSRHAYIALVSPGAEPGIKNPLGISESKDGGATWWSLENSPMDIIITRLVIDPQWQGVLFGVTNDASWQFALSVPSTLSADPTNNPAPE